MLTAEQRQLRARLAAYAMHAQGKTSTAAATAASLARFEREVDPEGTLPPATRARRAEFARKAYMTSLAFKSSRARQKRTCRKTTPGSDSAGVVTEGTSNARQSQS